MSRIEIFVMDVDGTLTDGKIYMGNEGEMCKAFHVKDGCGIHDILLPRGIMPVIITGRSSSIVKRRCEELEIKEIFQGIRDKWDVVSKILKEKAIECENVAYIGDDVNDLYCMKVIKENHGVVGCPADAVKEVKEISDFISSKNGGNGAVREFIEWVLMLD